MVSGGEGVGMELMVDYVHELISPRGRPSEGDRCRVQVYREAGERPVVVATELPDGGCIGDPAHYYAAEVILRNALPTPIVWVEHQTPETGFGRELFAVAVFPYHEPRWVDRGFSVGRPAWRHTRRDAVEALIGRPLERAPMDGFGTGCPGRPSRRESWRSTGGEGRRG